MKLMELKSGKSDPKKVASLSENGPNNVRAYKVIGLCGFARSGKDTMYAILKNMLSSIGIASQRIAFADALKEDCRAFLLNKTGIDSFTEDPLEKKVIRPFLVAYGCMMRGIDPFYWVNKTKDLAGTLIDLNIVPIYTDVRFLNELQWLGEEMSAYTLYIEREGTGPINDEEERNDPDLRKLVDQHFFWNNFIEDSPTKEEFELIESIVRENFCLTSAGG